MGSQLVATELATENLEAIGCTIGAGIGAVAGSIVGSIGIVGMGGAIGIPAAIVIGGSAFVLGMAGYTVGDVANNLTMNDMDFSLLVGNGSVLLIGVALIVDGARRLITDPKALSAMSLFKDRLLILSDLSSRVVARSWEELQDFIDELTKMPEDGFDASVSTGSAALGAGVGAAAGSAAAVGSVTVLGSQALGGVAVSLGLVSAPVWPIIAGLAGGAGIGYAAYKAIKYWNNKPDLENSNLNCTDTNE